MDEIVSDITSIFSTCSKRTFGINSSKAGKNKVNNGKFPWFERSCHEMRDVYHKTRKAYNKYKTQYFKNLLKDISKRYKSTLNQAKNKYNIHKIEKIRKLKHADPRKYWKILNDKKEDTESPASIEDFYQYFKQINENNNPEEETADQINNIVYSDVNEEINNPITEQEILKAVKSLKFNKAPGCDEIVNEQIKNSLSVMMPIYKMLFNIVFETGIIPELWTIGIVKPIYKNKGDPKLPENYRPISLLSCMGKLFTCIINNRLTTFADKTNLIHETQAGFRKGFSTVDNIFILKCLIDLVQSSKKKLYCCFVDFKQAFDSVWRVGLWQKLRKENINGKCFEVIKHLYDNIKSKVVTSGGSTDFFDCLVGVRQGENLSPFLFSIFLNDLEDYLKTHISGVSTDTFIEGTHIYLKLFILLYADDTVIFSDSEKDLQVALNKFETYCSNWKLNINTSKTKILVFSKGRPRYRRIFKIGSHELEHVSEYKYLGLLFAQSGSFYKAKKHIADQARKAMISLIRKIKLLALPYDLQIDMFEKNIKPILLYGSEIWGYGNVNILEKVQLQFYKYIFHLKKSTPSYMIYGETGVMPLNLSIKQRMVSYWARIIENINAENIKLSSKLYLTIRELHFEKKLRSDWIENVQQYLCSSGFSGVWYSQSFINVRWIIKSYHQRLRDMYIQSWFSDVSQTSHTNLYKYFKLDFKQSYYLQKLPNALCINLMKFFTRNHRLPIEIGRWQNIPYNERVCPNCREVGDEFHFMFLCPIFQNLREKYIDTSMRLRPSMQNFLNLINSKDVYKLRNFSIFCGKIMQHFTTV